MPMSLAEIEKRLTESADRSKQARELSEQTKAALSGQEPEVSRPVLPDVSEALPITGQTQGANRP